jgi:hypothetical protein
MRARIKLRTKIEEEINVEKTDLRKDLKRFYTAKEKPEIIEVPEFNFLTYTGRGEPGGVDYSEALNALYSSVYTLKFAMKKKGADFTVMTLEGLWWWDNPVIVNLEDAPPRETWNWKSMILVPNTITEEMLVETKSTLKKKEKPAENVKLERFQEGTSAQILHIGPFSEETRSQKILHNFIAEKGYRLRGRHHEIYLSDPRKSPPEKWRTILRHPVEPK